MAQPGLLHKCAVRYLVSSAYLFLSTIFFFLTLLSLFLHTGTEENNEMQKWIYSEMNTRCHPTRLHVPCDRFRGEKNLLFAVIFAGVFFL